MPSSSLGGSWLSGDVIGKGAANLKTNLVIPSGTYVPVIGVDLLAAGSIYIDPTTGLMRIMNSAGTHWELVQDSNLSHNQNGFPVNSSSYPNPSTLSTIAFTNATRTFTITPTGASYSVYVNGIEYTFTTAQTVVITATEGFWYIYYDNTGTLTASQAVWDFSITGMVCGLILG